MSEVIGDRVAALNFIFTTCAMTCPLQSMSLAKAQALLGAAMGRDVVFVSISLDPYTDTPTRLAAFADAHKAGADWHFFTGEPRLIDELRRGFEAYDPRRDEHPPVIAIGRAVASDWSRLYGLPAPPAIASEVDAWLA
ncbi:MAG: SCO family protein [Candidatus Competibacteraceae bacterium]|nr:SCO family protein [Candidatus Competibacteraceae bacterium]